MPHNLERFTQRARRILSLAQEEAERRKHNYIGPEHLLMGLMREEGGVAGRVLRDLGLEQRRVEEVFDELTSAMAVESVAGIDLSEATKQALELAVDEARRMGHHYIGTEHLLLGLMRQSESVALEILKRFAVSPEEVRRQTRRVLQESPVQPASTPQSSQPVSLPRPTISFSVWESVTMKILNMVEAQKLTTEQAIGLLGALHPFLPLTLGEIVKLENLFNPRSPEVGTRAMRFILFNNQTGLEQVNIAVSLESALSAIDSVLRGAMNRQLGSIFEVGIGDNLEIKIEIDVGAKIE
jgi:hypothetical protein